MLFAPLCKALTRMGWRKGGKTQSYLANEDVIAADLTKRMKVLLQCCRGGFIHPLPIDRTAVGNKSTLTLGRRSPRVFGAMGAEAIPIPTPKSYGIWKDGAGMALSIAVLAQDQQASKQSRILLNQVGSTRKP